MSQIVYSGVNDSVGRMCEGRIPADHASRCKPEGSFCGCLNRLDATHCHRCGASLTEEKTHQQLIGELSELFISWNQRCMDPTFPPDEEEKADHRAHVAEYRRQIAKAAVS